MKKLLLPAAIIICAAAAITMIILLISSSPGGEFTPPPFDPAARSGMPDVPESAEYGDIDTGDFKIFVASNLIVKDGKTDLWLTNPSGNNVWIKVRIFDQNEQLLGESGLIRPGEYLRSIKLDAASKDNITATLKIMAYEPDTYESAGAVPLTIDLKFK